MAMPFKYSCYKSSFSSVQDVMDHMQELHHELRRTEMANLQFFNITYFIITKQVSAKMSGEYFSEKTVMKKLDINFAGYYFDALRKYVDNQKTTPAWEIMFDFCKKDVSIPIIYLALGVNAHVNNDLGLSLFEIVKETEFKKDFKNVDRVIFDSLDEVLQETTINPFYKQFMKALIWHWRNKAWNNYLNLKKRTITKETIEKNAQEIAESLAKIYSVKDFYYLYKII